MSLYQTKRVLKMMYYAHSRNSSNSDKIEYQLLKEHLFQVAEKTKQFSAIFGASHIGYLAGILHDIGKYSDEFQQRIRGCKSPVDHSSAGTQWIMENYSDLFGKKVIDEMLAKAVAWVISGHHGGLLDYGTVDQEGTLRYRLSKGDLPNWSSAWNEIEIKLLPNECVVPPIFSKAQLQLKTNPDLLAWKYGFFVRMLYSCLVDADSIDTRDFCNPYISELLSQQKVPTMVHLLSKFDEFMVKKLVSSKSSIVNQYRKQILDACNRQSELSPRMFSLSVPTGGGKTLSSLSFALRHAVSNNKRRIIYVIPFTSIIEQNAMQFRNAVGDEYVLEHHSNFVFDNYEGDSSSDAGLRMKINSENWDAPIVVTTSVQFFDSLFSNKRSKCRKLHNIANSIIILDEAQSIPRGYLTPCLQALKELVDSYNCSVVLSTATQPAWSELGFPVTEIMDNPKPEELTNALKRVNITITGNIGEETKDSQIVEWMAESDQVLCIVNTRKHAKAILNILNEKQVEAVYHLSGRMCAKHRTDILNEVRRRLNNRENCRLISTQLIEAGVDVDFPLVLRSIAGLDSIAQAAGRCNREGTLKFGSLKVFYPEKHGMPSRGWLTETSIETQNSLKYVKGDDPLSLDHIKDYFQRVHGIYDQSIKEVTDSKNIMNLLKQKNQNREIPFKEIGESFSLIEENMFTIVVPYDDNAMELIHQQASSLYSTEYLRKLQPYSVQIYPYEFYEFQNQQLIGDAAGIMYLVDKSYYDSNAGLLVVKDTPISEVLIH